MTAKESYEAQRRRKVACLEYRISFGKGGDWDTCIATVNEKLEKEGLPPFTSYKEMMQAIEEQLAEEARAHRMMADLLIEGGANSAADLIKKSSD